MKAHLQISVKDFQRNKNLKIQLARVPFTRNRQFWGKMDCQPLPKDANLARWARNGWPPGQECAGAHGVHFVPIGRHEPTSLAVSRFSLVSP
jgi:hypothetical protein